MGATMRKWEYLEVYKSNSYDLSFIVANGQQVTPEPIDLYHYLDQLGTQGWEMVGITVTPVGVVLRIFKRVKADEGSYRPQREPNVQY